MSCLLIGGRADGRWVTDPGMVTYTVAIPGETPSSFPSVPTVRDYHHYTETYRREVFRTNNITVFFYRQADMSLDDAVLQLFRNYRPDK